MKNIHRAAASLAVVVCLVGLAGTAFAATAVNMGTLGSFAVLGGSTVTNTGPTVINGDLGLSPGTSVTGFPPGIVNGTMHITDAVAAQAQADAATAYNAASGQTTGVVTLSGDLGGQTLTPGLYKSSTSIGLTGTLTLDGQGNPGAVFIFQVGSTLTTASASHIVLINGAQACNIFWQVGSSATLGTNSSFTGTILALSSVTVTTGASVNGRVVARNGAVTLDTNPISVPTCAAPVVVPVVVTATTTATTTPIVIVTATTTPTTTTATTTPTTIIQTPVTLAPVTYVNLNSLPPTGHGWADELWSDTLNLIIPSALFALLCSLYLFRKRA